MKWTKWTVWTMAIAYSVAALIFLMGACMAYAEDRATNNPTTVDTAAATAPSGAALDVSMLQMLTPLLVPLLIAGAKKLADDIPGWALVTAAALVGLLANWIISKSTGATHSPMLGLLLGIAGIGVRELKDQIGKRITGGPAATMGFAVLLCVGIVGCASNPSVTHVTRITGTGTKFGVQQNPVTGLYELGIERVQSEVVWIPVYAVTNGNGTIVMVVPDVVSRYEVNTHSAVFGNAALTSTMSTGSNAVQTQVGGQSPPINVNTGTSNNLTPLSH